MKVSTYEKLDEALLMWFFQARSQGIPLNDPILEEVAIVLKDKLGGEALNFKASNGFLCRFKERHNICFKTIQGEKCKVKFQIKNITYQSYNVIMHKL